MTLPVRHLLIAIAVVAIWGSNFVVIKYALNVMPPMLLAALRFALAFFPACLFVPRPKAGWRNLSAYGVLIGVGQFGLVYIAMRSEISPGLASVVVQTQVFFTLLIAVLLTGERVQLSQWIGIALAAFGIASIVMNTDGATSLLGLLMVLGAALSWALGNTVGKRAGQVNMLAYMVWSSVFAVPPLLMLSLLIDGPSRIAIALSSPDAETWAAVLWQAVGNTLFGYGSWAWLLARHPTSKIVPMALLVPVFGLGASSLFLAEQMPAWKLTAAAFVLCGLGVNLFGHRVIRHRETAATESRP